MAIKKLLSLPPNLLNYFHKIESLDRREWFCTSDPTGRKLGSGGGTTWLLKQWEHSKPELRNDRDIPNKRIILHAGGQSRRLPAYAPSGKILTPIPVFRWARGQRIDQNLLELQLPLLEQMISEAPRNINTLIASRAMSISARHNLWLRSRMWISSATDFGAIPLSQPTTAYSSRTETPRIRSNTCSRSHP